MSKIPTRCNRYSVFVLAWLFVYCAGCFLVPEPPILAVGATAVASSSDGVGLGCGVSVFVDTEFLPGPIMIDLSTIEFDEDSSYRMAISGRDGFLVLANLGIAAHRNASDTYGVGPIVGFRVPYRYGIHGWVMYNVSAYLWLGEKDSNFVTGAELACSLTFSY